MQLRYRGIPYQLNLVEPVTNDSDAMPQMPMQYRGAQVRLSYPKLSLSLISVVSAYTAKYRGVPYQWV
jgi:hypothetical protein